MPTLSDTIRLGCPPPSRRPNESSDLVISVRRRLLAAASLAAVASLTLSACGTSFDAQTNKVYQPAVGANARGEVDVLGALLVANTDGSATVSASLVNNFQDEQQLSSVSAATLDGKPLAVKSLKTALPLASDQLTSLGGASDAGGFVVTSGAPAGQYVELTFTFSDTGPVTVEAPVVARTEEYANVAGGDGLVPSEVSGGESE